MRLPLITFLLLLAGLPAGMIPFVLPWDDTSDNLTNFSSSLHAPAGRFGRVTTTPEGHYDLAGERLRFFGVNIGAGACFPPQAKARTIARRLARFGFNAARFHHLENTWSTTLIDYSRGNSRHFDPVQLDRLDKFLHELAQAGVYLNLNLLTSRLFSAGDGLDPSIGALDWKVQHMLAAFDQALLALQQEHARNLLTHLNPYSGLRYVDDPAVAFIEVNNENGLAHLWLAGDLDALGPHYESLLATRWNAWLAARFPSTAALRARWGAVDEPLGAELLANGDFSGGTASWNLEQHQGAAASLTPGTFAGRPGARLTTTQVGSAAWHVQLFNSGLSLTGGQLYTVSFWARADAPFALPVVVNQAHEPWQGLGLSTTVNLTSAWQQFTFTFYASQTDANARFGFSGLGGSLQSVYLSSLSLRPGGAIDPIPADASLEARTLPLLRSSGDQLLPQRRDWFDFLRDTEGAYWSEMRRFLRQDLGYPGILWGTTVMNSPPSLQAAFDAIDTHTYWAHPQFAQADWDPVNWTVENTSMVNHPAAGVLDDLASQSVRGRPHNVTEYQHAAPNTYSTEAGLFLGLYGSLQDWDGLYIFHYGSGPDDWDRGYFNGFFDLDQHPAKLANAALAALLFRRFDLQPAQQSIHLAFDSARELDLLATRGAAWNISNLSHLDLPPNLPLLHRVQMDLSAGPDALLHPPPAPPGPVFTADTGEISWDLSQPSAGVVTFSAPRARGVFGFDAGRTFDLGGVVFDPGASLQNWSTLALLLLRGSFDDLAGGASGLVVATGQAENTGMVWNDANRTSVGANWGRSPSLVENVPARLTLPVPPGRLAAWALDPQGQRAAPLPITAGPSDGSASFDLGGPTGALWYEFAIAPLAAPAAPSALQVVARSSSTLHLSWTPPARASHFLLEYSPDGQSWLPAGELPAGTHSARLAALPGDQNFLVRLRAANGLGETLSPVATARTRRPYAAWAAQHFAGLPPGLHLPAADPDRDGLSNALESIFATDPLAPNCLTPSPAALAPAPAFSAPVDPDAELVPHLRLLLSPNLQSWSPLPPPDPHASPLLFTAPPPLPAPAFFRWGLLHPGP